MTIAHPVAKKPRVAALVASRNRPDLVDDAIANLRATCNAAAIDMDIIVVDCGSDPGKLSPHTTIHYADPDFRGKCFGHNVALDFAQRQGHYDYYWVLHNDVRFDGALDPAATLIAALQSDPRMAICSPYNIDGQFPQGFADADRDWHPVCLCDYLGFMIKAAAVDAVGFLDGRFRYCWGAIHELAFKLNRAGWFIAYSDKLAMKHLGGSTYGAAGTNTITRDEYQTRAMRFAHDWMRERYGERWDKLFWAAAEPFGVEFNTFAYHRQFWSRAFTESELADRAGTLDAARQRCAVTLPDESNAKNPTAASIDEASPADLADQIASLHPWFSPVQIGPISVPPGVGTEWSATKLSNRIACRQTLIVDQVARRIDLQGARVLELAANCGYWSARYAERGAATVLGIEGRPEYVRQAELYWSVNRFLPDGCWSFEQGDIADEAGWSRIADRGPFDVVICAGILYHVPNYRAVLTHAASVTRGSIVVDTRVCDDDEKLVTEPGDLKFNAIVSRLDKVVPNRAQLIAHLESLGFEVATLTPAFAAVPGLQNVDDYAAGRRVTLLATRPAVQSNAASPVRLHLGCGAEKRPGWINVDANPAVEPDAVARVDDLSHFADASADEIDACHLFEHLTLDEARAALREWRRVLKPGARLTLELPNLDACIRSLGKHLDRDGYDLAMVGLYGYPPDIAAAGVFQMHKWGWTPATLAAELEAAGFDRVERLPVTQTWRPAARFDRDMRLTANRRADAGVAHRAG